MNRRDMARLPPPSEAWHSLAREFRRLADEQDVFAMMNLQLRAGKLLCGFLDAGQTPLCWPDLVEIAWLRAKYDKFEEACGEKVTSPFQFAFRIPVASDPKPLPDLQDEKSLTRIVMSLWLTCVFYHLVPAYPDCFEGNPKLENLVTRESTRETLGEKLFAESVRRTEAEVAKAQATAADLLADPKCWKQDGDGGAKAKKSRKQRRTMTTAMLKRAILLVADGASNALIAAQLKVSESTVKRNVQGARSRLKGASPDAPCGYKAKEGMVEAYGDSAERRRKEDGD